MKIKDLEYIHQLLVENETVAKESMEESIRLAKEFKDEGKPATIVERQEAAANRLRSEYETARIVLENFEQEKW